MPKKIIIIGQTVWANRRIKREIERRGHTAAILDPQTVFGFDPQKKPLEIYVQSNSKQVKVFTSLSANAIIPRIGRDLEHGARILQRIRGIGIPSTSSYTGLLTAQDKLATMQKLIAARLRVPTTASIRKAWNVDFIIEGLGGLPIVAKPNKSSQGNGMFMIDSPTTAKAIIEAFIRDGQDLLLQQFIETKTKDMPRHDYRVVVIDGKAVASMRRVSSEDFRTNTGKGNKKENADLPQKVLNTAVYAAQMIGLECAGVDIAIDAKDNTYIYEINGNFNFKSTEKATGVNVAGKIAEYAIRIANDHPVSKEGEALFQELGAVPGLNFGEYNTYDYIEDEETELSPLNTREYRNHYGVSNPRTGKLTFGL